MLYTILYMKLNSQIEFKKLKRSVIKSMRHTSEEHCRN